MESHQDHLKLWFQLTIEQQLNCFCDLLVKVAITESLNSTSFTTCHCLSRESMAVYVNGLKQKSQTWQGESDLLLAEPRRRLSTQNNQIFRMTRAAESRPPLMQSLGKHWIPPLALAVRGRCIDNGFANSCLADVAHR